jgi:hypothetical protein
MNGLLSRRSSQTAHPAIRMNYFGDAHDMKVMLAVLRRPWRS